MTWAVILAAGKRVIAFFTTPAGRYIGLVLIASALLFGVRHAGYEAGEAACEASHKAAVAAEVQRQERAATAVVAASEARTAADTAKDKTNQETIRYVVKTVYTRPDAGIECVPAAIADRLRSLN